MPSAISQLVPPNHHSGRHSLGGAFCWRPPPESSPAKKLKAGDTRVALSGIRPIERNRAPHPADWRAGCNTHCGLTKVTAIDRDASPTRELATVIVPTIWFRPVVAHRFQPREILHAAETTFVAPPSARSVVVLPGGTFPAQCRDAAPCEPGFIRVSRKSYITINAPSGSNVVNAQGINDKDVVAGFYVGNDGQDHGFMVDARGVERGTLTGTAIADPTIPQVTGEPGATFMFSQILGINDKGIAVGYYGDSTGSQHGFLYDTKTAQYTFVDDPSEAFYNGAEVTQITGITNSGEITGFYSDANGVFHGFVATPHVR
jgi:hypothetical protein